MPAFLLFLLLACFGCVLEKEEDESVKWELIEFVAQLEGSVSGLAQNTFGLNRIESLLSLWVVRIPFSVDIR
jgi:hypothetical protein